MKSSLRFGAVTLWIIVCCTWAGETVLPSSRLHSWWPGDSDANDIRGHNHLTLKDGASLAPGFVHDAFSFQGEKSHAICASRPVVATADNWGFEGWVYWRGIGTTPGAAVLFIFYNGINPSNGYGLGIVGSPSCAAAPDLCGKDGQIVLTFGGVTNYATGITLAVSTWTHVGVSRENGVVVLYMNGTEVFRKNTVSPKTPTTQFTLSSSVGSFNGLIDEPGMYDYPVDAQSVRTTFLADFNGRVKPAKLPSLPAPGGMKVWWSGDKSSADLLGLVHGEFRGNTKYSPGKVGMAFDFDGTNSWVVNPSMLAINKTDDWAFSCWILWRGRMLGAGKVLHGIFHNGHSGKNGFGLIIPEDNSCSTEASLCPYLGQLVIVYGGIRYIPTGVELTPGEWTHLALTRSAGTVTLFKDAKIVFSERTIEPNVPTQAGVSLGLGPTAAINGLVDEACFYERFLTEEDVLSMFAAGAAGMVKSPEFSRTVLYSGRVYLHCKGLTGTPMTLEKQTTATWSEVVTVGPLDDEARFSASPDSPFAFYRLRQ